MARLARLVAVLSRSERGVPVEDIYQHVMPGDIDQDSKRKALSRDVEHLNSLGYDIRNVAPTGSPAVLRLRASDNRLRVALTPRQRGELARAALATRHPDLVRHLDDDNHIGARRSELARAARSDRAQAGRQAPPQADLPHMDLVIRAASRRCLVEFEYKGEPRHVNPVAVHSGPSGWYLSGRESGGDVVKQFVVSRMSGVRIGPPGSAEPVDQPARPSLDPLSWQIDPPVEAVLEVEAVHRPLVENVLGKPAHVSGTETVRLTYVVTHRDVFRWRLYELGTRVHVLEPEELRQEILAELRAAAGVTD